jgi:molybdenum cofactor cytidylyltransferase
MPPYSKLAAVILAAGESTRMGSDKALLALPARLTSDGPTETFLSAAIKCFSNACDDVVVVAGRNAPSLSPVAVGPTLVINPDPSRGQFSSLQVGLQEALNRDCDAAFVTLVDCLPPSAVTLSNLRSAFESAEASVWVIVPEYRCEHGHPYIAGQSMIEAFLKAPASSSARDVKRDHQAHVQYLAVDDPHIVVNVNTPADYSRIRA